MHLIFFQNINKDTVKKSIIGILVLITTPWLVKFLCIGFRVSDGIHENWIGFFGSYLGGAFSAIISIYVLYRTLWDSKLKKQLEDEQKNYDELCKDLSELCSSVNIDEFAFLFIRLYDANIHEVNAIIKELHSMETHMRKTYNSFALKYDSKGNYSSKEIMNYYLKVSNYISRCIDEVILIVCANKKALFVCRKINKRNYQNQISKIAKNIEGLGDVTSQLFYYAQKMKCQQEKKLDYIRNKYESH